MRRITSINPMSKFSSKTATHRPQLAPMFENVIVHCQHDHSLSAAALCNGGSSPREPRSSLFAIHLFLERDCDDLWRLLVIVSRGDLVIQDGWCGVVTDWPDWVDWGLG